MVFIRHIPLNSTFFFIKKKICKINYTKDSSNTYFIDVIIANLVDLALIQMMHI